MQARREEGIRTETRAGDLDSYMRLFNKKLIMANINGALTRSCDILIILLHGPTHFFHTLGERFYSPPPSIELML